MTDEKRISTVQALASLRKKWDDHHAKWLTGTGDWPLTFVLHKLTEKGVFGSLVATRDWVQDWRRFDPHGCTVEWEHRRWASGTQELPQRLSVPTPEAAADLLGRRDAWERAKARRARLMEHFPQLRDSRVLARWCDGVLTDYEEADFDRLGRLLQWFIDNPRSGLYLRQLPVPDVDTKWVETRRAAVGDFVRELLNARETATFHELCGLRTEPWRMRLRVLCPELRAQVGGLCDIEAPVSEIAALPLRPRNCLIVENLNTGIALPDIPGTVAFMRLGLAVHQLEAIAWAPYAKRHFYWGDLDTHGFTALGRARRRFPGLKSLLMDEETLLAHRSMWVREPKPSRVAVPEGLSDGELAVYTGLLTDRWESQVRLEQERIAWDYALQALARSI